MWIRSIFCEELGPELSRSTSQGRYPSMVKPQVYLETTIISYLVGWLSRHDLYVAANQEFTTRLVVASGGMTSSCSRQQFVVKEARDRRARTCVSPFELSQGSESSRVTEEANLLKAELLRGAALSCQRRTRRAPYRGGHGARVGLSAELELPAHRECIHASEGLRYLLARWL